MPFEMEAELARDILASLGDRPVPGADLDKASQEEWFREFFEGIAVVNENVLRRKWLKSQGVAVLEEARWRRLGMPLIA